VPEMWRAVVGHEGRYEVSDQGRVRSLLFAPPRVLSPYIHRDGYPVIDFCLGGGPKRRLRNQRVHCLVLEAFIGPRPAGMYGCHNDGDPSNNRLENLRWDTPSSNLYDRVRHGRDHNVAKLSCPRAHLLRAPNLQPDALKHGRRACLACTRARHLNRIRLCRGDRGLDIQQHADFVYGELMAGRSGQLLSRSSNGQFARAMDTGA
jgi:hypothetical protein